MSNEPSAGGDAFGEFVAGLSDCSIKRLRRDATVTLDEIELVELVVSTGCAFKSNHDSS